MNDNWHFAKLNPLDPDDATNLHLGFYDQNGALRYYSTGDQWFFCAKTGKPTFYRDGTNLYAANGQPILLNVDKTLLKPPPERFGTKFASHILAQSIKRSRS